MSQLLPHLVSAVLGAILAALGWWTARSRADGARDEREQAMRERLALADARLEKLATDLNRLGGVVREMRTVLGIAGHTGQVPRFEPRRSGEGRSL